MRLPQAAVGMFHPHRKSEAGGKERFRFNEERMDQRELIRRTASRITEAGTGFRMVVARSLHDNPEAVRDPFTSFAVAHFVQDDS